jgi:hypothetical protein
MHSDPTTSWPECALAIPDFFPLTSGSVKSHGEHRWGCLLGVLPDVQRKTLTDWTLENVLDAHLGPGGRELRPHVTVAYGFDEPDLDKLKEICHHPYGLTAHLTGHSYFEPGPDGAPWKYDIASEDLLKLHDKIRKNFPLPGEKYHSYRPHVTIAYLDPSARAVYAEEVPPLIGEHLVLHELFYVSPDGQTQTVIPITQALPILGTKSHKQPDEEVDWELWKEIVIAFRGLKRPQRTPYKIGRVRGFKIMLVDGDRQKIEHNMDYIEGGNGYRYSWIPKDEIWLDDSLETHDLSLICYHEVHESLLMMHGMKYETAHEKADKAERVLRVRYFEPHGKTMPELVKGSYFDTCPRDERGHCLPEELSDRMRQKETDDKPRRRANIDPVEGPKAPGEPAPVPVKGSKPIRTSARKGDDTLVKVYVGIPKDHTPQDEFVFISTSPELASLHGMVHEYQLLPGAVLHPDPALEEQFLESHPDEEFTGAASLKMGSALVHRMFLGRRKVAPSGINKKTMSWLAAGHGAELVKPPKFPKKLKDLRSQYRAKSHFVESQHPRGQPENTGQFVESGRESTARPKPPEVRPASSRGKLLEQLKKTGHNIQHIEQVAKEWAQDRIEENLNKLPPRIQSIAQKVWVAIRFGTKASFVTYQAGQALAERIALAKGVPPEQARRLRAVLSAIDVMTLKPVSIGLGAMAGPAASLGVSFIPVGSFTYLAYSTATDPMATLRAAKQMAQDMIIGRKDLDTTELVEEICTWLDYDSKMALLLALLDETNSLDEAWQAARGSKPDSSPQEKALLDYDVKAGFTGMRRDRLGRRFCFRMGVRVPCVRPKPVSTPKKPSAKPLEVQKRPETPPEEHQGSKPAKLSSTRVKIGKAPEGVERAFRGDQVNVQTKLSKQLAGVIGEKIAIHYLKSIGLEDARTADLDRNNFPLDVIAGFEAVEVKTGNAGNGPGAQQWRLTIGEPGKKEKEWLAKATPEEKAFWNANKQQMIHDRKGAALKELESKLGGKVKARTIALILDPDRGVADVYSFDDWHDRIGWNSEQAKKGYVRSFTYEVEQ